MPTIKVTARLENTQPATPIPHQWKVNLVFTGATCKHSMNRRIEHSEISASTLTNTFTIPFSQLRGGDLAIEVTVRTGNSIGGMVTGRSQGLKVIGTNPSTGALLRAAIMTDAFKRLMRHESGLQQFRPAQCPYFSRDNLGGVGICQITNPRPTDEENALRRARQQRLSEHLLSNCQSTRRISSSEIPCEASTVTRGTGFMSTEFGWMQTTSSS